MPGIENRKNSRFVTILGYVAATVLAGAVMAMIVLGVVWAWMAVF